jgi:hypothetical protein
MTQDLASHHKTLSQVDQIAPFMAASAVPPAPPPAFLEKRLDSSDLVQLPSRSTPLTQRSFSDDPLTRQNQSTQHDCSSTQGSSRRHVPALEISEETIDGVSAQTAHGAPPVVTTAFPESTLLDQDVKSQASCEPSLASSKCRIRTRLLGRGPVFGRQKEVLDPRIIVRQLSTEEYLDPCLTSTRLNCSLHRAKRSDAVCLSESSPQYFSLLLSCPYPPVMSAPKLSTMPTEIISGTRISSRHIVIRSPSQDCLYIVVSCPIRVDRTLLPCCHHCKKFMYSTILILHLDTYSNSVLVLSMLIYVG